MYSTFFVFYHQTFDNTKIVVNDFGDRSQAIRCAGGIAARQFALANTTSLKKNQLRRHLKSNSVSFGIRPSFMWNRTQSWNMEWNMKRNLVSTGT